MDSLPVSFVSSHAKLGGSERYLETLLGQLGHAWTAGIVSLEEGPLAARLRDLGYPLEVFPTSGRWASLLWSAWRLRRTLLRTRPAVVHANGIKAALVAVLATVGTRLPIVWVKHDHSWDGPLAIAIALRCRLIVGVSRAVTSVFSGRIAQHVRVAYTGMVPPDVDRRQGRAALLAALAAREGARIVGIVGYLAPGKGQHELVEVAPELLRRLPNARFALVGAENPSAPGYETELRRRVTELGLDGTVRFLGHRDDALTLIAGLDVVVVTTLPRGRVRGGEGFGLAALEALALGTPVVGYDAGALREVVGECGALVPPGDRAALVEALYRVFLEDSTSQRMARCGRYRARSLFSQERWIERMKEYYREAARR
jgi:glycosyltransferase involved in cell wall biosynthesis